MTLKRGLSVRLTELAIAVFAVILPLILAPLTAHAATPTTAPTTANANANFNITTSPLPIQLVTTPGKPVSTDLRFQNSGTKTTYINASVIKFKSDDKTGHPILIKRQPGSSYLDWATLSKTSFVAEPGEWNTVTLTITPPASAAYGYYYAVLFSQDPSTLSNTAKASKLAGATATLVLLDVQVPGEKRKLEVTSFTADHKLFEYLPVKFNIAVHNSGNVHMAPGGNIFITRGGSTKKPIAILDFNKNEGNILPKSTRTFTESWEDGFPLFVPKRDNGQIVTNKKGIVEQDLKWDFAKANKLRFGHYNAHLLAAYSDGDKDIPIEADVGFWVLPWKAMPIIALILVLVLIGLVSVVKSFKRKLTGKNAQPTKPKKSSPKT